MPETYICPFCLNVTNKTWHRCECGYEIDSPRGMPSIEAMLTPGKRKMPADFNSVDLPGFLRAAVNAIKKNAASVEAQP